MQVMIITLNISVLKSSYLALKLKYCNKGNVKTQLMFLTLSFSVGQVTSILNVENLLLGSAELKFAMLVRKRECK